MPTFDKTRKMSSNDFLYNFVVIFKRNLLIIFTEESLHAAGISTRQLPCASSEMIG